MSFSGMKLIPIVIGVAPIVIGVVVGSTCIVFIICARLFRERMPGLESRPMSVIDSRLDLEQPEHHRIIGLQPGIVAAIPTMRFTREAFSSLEDAQCTICLGEYREKEVLRIMPKCGHSFHVSCIDVWLRKQSTCPVCCLSVEDPFKMKYVRPAMLEVAPTIHTPEIVTEYSQQWLLPVAERSEGNGSNQGNIELAPENLEINHSGVAEARS